MNTLLCAVAVVVGSVSVYGQVAVNESAVRAHLVSGVTTVTFAATNQASKPLRAHIVLQWVGPNGEQHQLQRSQVELKPGANSFEIKLPLDSKHDPLTERLLYEVVSDYRNLAAFDQLNGALSFANIAEHAFVVSLATSGLPNKDETYEVQVFTANPITGKPVAGVNLECGDSKAVSDQNGMGVLHIKARSDDNSDSDEVEGTLGDFTQSADLPRLPANRGRVEIQSDKPLYQSGQTMHLRVLAFKAHGQADSGAKYQLTIDDNHNSQVFGASLKLSKFGIGSADWQIPANAKAGTYEVTVEDEDDETRAERTFAIRRYELPSFRVTAQSKKTFYLTGEKAVAEVQADYLFGKALSGGKVRITDDNEKVMAEGQLDAMGHFESVLEPDAPDNGQRFVDTHYIALVTDTTTNRTEQKKFDLRISRDALHVYVARQESTPTGTRLFVTTFSPDGTPAQGQIEAKRNGQVLATGQTNRFGIGRLDLANLTGAIDIDASGVDKAHVTQRYELNNYDENRTLWMETDRVLYRRGEAVTCRITSKSGLRTALLMAWNKAGKKVFSEVTPLKNGSATVEVPYKDEFGRELQILATGGALSLRDEVVAPVLFPGEDELKVTGTALKASYKPGDRAEIQFRTSEQTALGIAVIDQSVIERANTDSEFGHQRWFERESYQQKLGDLTYSRLLRLNPAKLEDDIQLAARFLVDGWILLASDEDALNKMNDAFTPLITNQLIDVRRQLDARYLETLNYPRDEAAYSRLFIREPLDPWLQPYQKKFTTEGLNDVMRFCSSGADKMAGTADDFCPFEVRRPWFTRYKLFIDDALEPLKDYPATEEEFLKIMAESGLNFPALRDPWKNALRLKLDYEGQRRVWTVVSAGPDGQFGTSDDMETARFAGPYFAAMGRKLQQAIDAAEKFPSNETEMRAALHSAGIELTDLKDPWGHGFYVSARTDNQYYDKIRFYTYTEYGKPQESRKELIPQKHPAQILELRSLGPDGVRDTFDDFAIQTFVKILEGPGLFEGPKSDAGKNPQALNGKGAIRGVLTDQSGAVLPNALVILEGAYKAQTDSTGTYLFTRLPAGFYDLRFESPGFQVGEMSGVPVFAGHITDADFTLNVGSVSSVVEVQSVAAPILTTQAASISHAAASSTVSTPRVRDYFPETLYWQPELITDKNGRAKIDLKLADTITTWHVAVVASTVDGKMTEAETSLLAMQPFQAGLDVPPVLTEGDHISLPVPIRNYLDKKQDVNVKAEAPPSLMFEHGTKQPGVVPKDSSANAVLYLKASAASDSAKLRVSAFGSKASDAIEKTTAIHPDGERVERSTTSILSGKQKLELYLEPKAIAGSMKAEVKIYPSLVSRLLESMEAILQRPWGCGEQTISSTYPNLMYLRALKKAGLSDEHSESRARKNLQDGYQRLLAYQNASGGFQYWPHSEPDPALTAYAIRFLNDAREFLTVDEDRLADAAKWLAKQDTKDSAVNSYSLEALAEAHADSEILKRLNDLARKAAEFDDPYAMAAFALGAMKAGKAELAASTIQHLMQMVQDDEGAAYWSLRANTVFHGWGRTGQVETTGMVLSALAAWRQLPEGQADAKLTPLMNRGVLFLLKNTERSGIWASGQATVRALDALLSVLPSSSGGSDTVQLLVNGAAVKQLSIAEGRVLAGPITVDISSFVKDGVNEVSVISKQSRPVETQFAAAWYEPWAGGEKARDFTLETKYSSLDTGINDAVKANVKVSRPSFRGFGMMIAEVGLPPGAEVDRGSLEAIEHSFKTGIDSYEVAPDHVTFYVWPRADDSAFEFIFRPRYAMDARLAQSDLYDYYNPAEKVVIPPERILVK